MKKLLAAMLAAAAVTAGTSMVAFADGGYDGGNVYGTSRSFMRTVEDGISFLPDTGTDINGGLLTPGKEYKFQLQYTSTENDNQNTVDFGEDQIKGNKFIVENKSGRGTVEYFRVSKEGGKYYLNIKPKATYPTKQTDVEYRLRLVNAKTGETLNENTISFRTGYQTISDDDLAPASVDESIYIPNEAPVITKEQFEQINSYTNGKEASFTNGDWTISVRVGGLEDRNLISNASGIHEVETKFENNEFKFLNFPANPKFDYTAKVRVDVSSDAENFGDTFHLYRYSGGQLTKMDSKYDKDESVVTFSTKELGRFVLTNRELTDSDLINSGSTSSDDTTSGSTSSGGTSSGNGIGSGNGNPNTGASAGLGVASALAASSLAAGALALKKRK